MRWIFSRFAKPSRRRRVRRREVFAAQFDGGQSAAAACTSIHLGCDVLERRIVLTASPQGDFVFSQGTITGYTGTGGAVEIPSMVGGVPVAAIGLGAFQNNSTITSIVIPDSVKLIYDKAFQGMSSLESAKIGNGVIYVGDRAFQNNSKLATVSFGSRVTTIGGSAFDGAGLTAVTIPGTVRSIGNHAFGNNAALTRVRFVGNAPNVGTDAFAGAVAGATAIRAASLTGYGRYGSIWKNLIVTLPGRVAAPTVTASRAEAPRFLSAFWGLDDGMPQQICPCATALDGMPITFSWLINPASVDPADFNVIRSDGTVTVPTCATLRPANESNETQTILLTGDFGDTASGVRPVRVRLVGQLSGSPPGSKRSEVFSDLVSPPIRRLSAGPSIVDAWRIDPALLTNDANACTVGSAFVRVVWSGGITDFPTGNEVGVAVTRAYRLTYLHRGKTVTVAPLEIGDLNDGDNMHDLSFPAIPARAKLLTITLPGRHVEDPNGDPNSFQVFRFREPNLYPTGWRPSRR